MKNKVGFFTSILFIIFTLSSCDKKPITPDDISKNLLVSYIKGNEIIKSGYLLVSITNMSSECISFPIDYGLELYLLENGARKEIKNKTQYVGNGPYKLYPYDEGGFDDVFLIHPDLSSLLITQKTDFVAIIKGQLCDDDLVIITKEIPFFVSP